VTQVGEGRDAPEQDASLMTFGAPTVGEVLAERYELVEHINDDSVGRQVWRGADVVLRRPVAVVLRYPGGESAEEMLQAAVAASRVIHPNLVGVYDAIDEGERAYVVREWIEGAALREHVATGPLDAERATAVAHGVAAAVAAVHATGMVHGNIHPGSVLIGVDGRVVLADARADVDATAERDVRAIGGLLYFSLTGQWPHAEAGTTGLPDAVRDSTGTPAAPRQIRAGVPTHLDELTMDLLDGRLAQPSAEVLAAELARLDNGDSSFLEDPVPLRFTEEARPDRSTGVGRKIAAGVAGLLAIAVAGLLIGTQALSGGDSNASTGRSPGGGAETSGPNASGPAAQPVALTPANVRVVDPGGDRTELGGVQRAFDGDLNTGWDEMDRYKGPAFGNIAGKDGMGILIDLGEPHAVTSVKVDLSARGATARLRHGTVDPGNSQAGDKQINQTYPTIAEFVDYDGTTMAFGGFDPDTKYRYLLVWITKLPPDGDGRYTVGVQEISVLGH
jgi:eukaryotic-like serine/threonine-protein kinase